MSAAITNVYRAGRITHGARPPAIVFTFASQQLRLAFLRNKRNNVPLPSREEQLAGTKRYSVVEDLTAPTFKLLTAMRSDERVARAWTRDGRIKFTLVDNDTVFSVKSVFDTVDILLSNIIIK